MTDTTLEPIWDWLKACLTCGEVHQWRWTCPYPPPHGQRHLSPHGVCKGGTWLAEDGHYYRPRLNNNTVDELRSEYEAVSR